MKEQETIDYSALSEITVKSQAELDIIPDDFKGRIYVEFGTPFSKAIINRRFYYRVVARGNSSVEAWGNSSVVARGNSSVVAWENSSVVARGNSSVVARENSSVVARGNTQVVDYLQGAKIQISGNARIVYNPKTIHEFMDFYGIKHTKTKAILYKAVHKQCDRYVSDYRKSFEYSIGSTVLESCDQNTSKDCGCGIHISHLAWALDFGKNWGDLAILECETKISNIVLPKSSDGKARTSEVKVLREVPLDECGIFGKILAKRLGAK